jgi:hypothetical protein
MRPVNLFLAVSALIGGISPTVQACSCATAPSVQQALTGSTVVFTGKVAAIERVENSELNVHLLVRRAWKGITEEAVAVGTPSQGSACGYPFEIGQNYLVYAYRHRADQLHTNVCSRTTLLGSASADLQILGEPRYVGPLDDRERVQHSAVVGGALALGLGLALFVTLRRSRREDHRLDSTS